MNSSILIKLIRQTRLYHQTYINSSAYALHFSKKFSTQNPEAEELVVREKIQLSRPTVTLWKRPPFVKGLFFGKLDTELLAFPEILDKEQLEEVEKYVKDLNKLYAEKVNSIQIDKTGKIPDDVLQDLKGLGLFGRMMPLKYGGLDLTYTACTRLNEVIGLDWSLYSSLTAHEFLASRVILLFGTEEQKNKYLPLLATGKLIAAFCAAEFESGGDLPSISTTANMMLDGRYCISGTKCWVTNGEIADVFIVFARTRNNADPHRIDVSAFIVDRDAGGISTTPQEKICLKGVKSNVVHFKEAVVPKENLLGKEGSGYQIYLKVMEGFRIAMHSFTFGTLKSLLDSVTERIIHTERVEKSVGDMQLVRQRMSRIATKIYAMESVAYFTAAILDSTENPDVVLESAILKIFNSEGTLYCIKELMFLLGSSTLMQEQHLERFLRDAMGLHMFEGSNDVAKLLIGLVGLKMVGEGRADSIMKARNKLFFPLDTIKLHLRTLKLIHGRMKYDQDLAGHIHPSLTLWGNLLEDKLHKMQHATEEVLSNHGAEVVDTQIDPTKLADAAVQLYAEAAVLSRASRSYCIGLKNSHHEVDMAGAFCRDADSIISKSLNDIHIGIYRSNEGIHLLLGEQVIDTRGYFPEHPLKHNC